MARLVLSAPQPAPDAARDVGGTTADPRASSVARALRDAGHEVVLVAEGEPTLLARTAVQEDADLVVLLAGPDEAAGPGAPREDRGTGLRDALGQLGADDVRVGVLPLDAGPEAVDRVASADS